VQADEHLHRCLVYIDLNMVRAGGVKHPAEWAESGYGEIQAPRARYAVIDLAALRALCGFTNVTGFQEVHRQWIAEGHASESRGWDDSWSEAVAVGSQAFIEKVQLDLGIKARHRDVAEIDGTHTLRQPSKLYRAIFDSENGPLRAENTVFWETNRERPNT